MSNKNNDFKKYIPTIIYVILAIVIFYTVAIVLLPRLNKDSEIKEIDYVSFVNMVNRNQVKKAEVRDRTIAFEVEKDGKKIKYETNRMYDPNLVDRLVNKNVKSAQVYKPEMNPVLSFIISTVATFAIIIAFWLILSKFIFKKMGDVGPMNFGKSGAKIYVESTDGIKFDNVAGQDEAKEALSELVDFLHNPKKYTEIGAKLPKGALLVGPPGTGKTLLAKAVASEAEVPFFSISGSAFVEMFVGLGAAKVRDLFKQAVEKAPCIIFIDEIDTIGKKRDGSGFSGNDEREQTLNQLLSEMDGFDAKAGVVILAATNRPDSLDPALLRPGRFDRRIPVELPDLKGRVEILKVHVKDIKKEENIDYEKIGRATAGASGADLANMVNEAALRAVRQGRDKMSERDLEESVEVVLAGYEKKNAVISPREKRIIAYHEVGHALVAAKQKNSAPVHKITIIPRTSGALGYTMQVDEEEKFLMTKEDAINNIVTLTGGRSAEELIFNIRTSGASNDIEKATKIAKAMVTRFGMTDEFGFVALESMTNAYLGGDTSLQCSPQTQYEIDAAVQKIIDNAHDEARKILRENIRALHAISEYLLRQETITGEEFMDILKRYEEEEKLPQEDKNETKEEASDESSIN
ncbi:MAG: ATP-dependent zinc metalloprotease FtsH [Peptoniphilus harei]|uniref:ATP-dependent zinc metalloprotease FtsH n=1 Tax=Peptoniphilus harei TaxID=54005 RepID=UPI00254B2AAA|nr:ATP-dependent zinc metalloprotease FtsH [Peptoniphilus harei]MDK7755098.1 ATP-dependent zinc metalloprotease FtsH [Peptoniphilus harei]MDK7760905.1 ATP-dependent zinc metalloprotease FtsH [Peptoniphilus harei]MDK8270695.1 ATP-dependent zinc metalloprotease FtsH [Peptoniphilus harei]MDK8339078.1 ATP-dependent zinc metalloprotease FtsH [Peptoniphilus harei]